MSQADLLKAAEKTKAESEKVLKAEDHTKAKLSAEQNTALKEVMQRKLDSAQEKKLEDLGAKG